MISWTTTSEELNQSYNLLEETLIQRLAEHLSDIIHPFLLADRGFERANLLRLLQHMYQHTERAVDYVVRSKGGVHIQTADGYQEPLRKSRYVLLLVSGISSCDAMVGTWHFTGARDVRMPGIW